MDVERGSVDDVDAVVDRWLALADEQRQYGSHVRAEANETRIREEIGRHAATDRLLVARDPETVGFATVTMERGTFDKRAVRGIVEAIYVVPDRRGEGIGSRLLERAEQTLRERGAERVALEALAGNADARRFYRRHGYEPHRVELEKPTESDSHSREGK